MIRKRGNAYGVTVYDPKAGRKVWAGTRPTLKEARALEREREAQNSRRRLAGVPTVAEWAPEWLDHFPRPEVSTNRQNARDIRAFVAEFADKRLDRIGRAEAREWASTHRQSAKVAAACLNDAMNAERFEGPNPLSRLGLPERRGRRDITPLTEAEVEQIVRTAEKVHGGYGMVYRAVVLFAAWVGTRPAEMWGLRWSDLDLARGEVRIERQLRPDGLALPKTKRQRTIVVPSAARDALLAMPRTIGEGYVFTTPTGALYGKGSSGYYWRSVRDTFTATLPATHWLPKRLAEDPKDKLDLYELRHFCGSVLADRGATARDIAHQLGNSPKVCEETYIHPYEDRVRDRLRETFERPEKRVSDLTARRVGGQMGGNGA